ASRAQSGPEAARGQDDRGDAAERVLDRPGHPHRAAGNEGHARRQAVAPVPRRARASIRQAPAAVDAARRVEEFSKGRARPQSQTRANALSRYPSCLNGEASGARMSVTLHLERAGQLNVVDPRWTLDQIADLVASQFMYEE